MGTQELTKTDIIKIIEQLDRLLPTNFIDKQDRGRKEACIVSRRVRV
jgi:hypothetical protein